jgi:uncharacterized RDD family membrane protein YckC
MSAAKTGIVYGGFWIRFAASIIDSVLVMVVITPLLVWIYGTGYIMDPVNEALGMVSLDAEETSSFLQFEGTADVLLNYVFPAIAIVLFWIARQATPGKMVLSLRIVDAETLGPISAGQAIGRYLGYYVSTLVFFLGFFWVAWDPRKQGWHDKLARTVVIEGKK